MLTAKLASAEIYIVVGVLILILMLGTTNPLLAPGVNPAPKKFNTYKEESGAVAEVAEIHPRSYETVVTPPLGTNVKFPQTSQSPAVNNMELISAIVPVVSGNADPEDLPAVNNSPMLPAFALLLVVVPTIPLVWLGVKLPVIDNALPMVWVPVDADNIKLAVLAPGSGIVKVADCPKEAFVIIPLKLPAILAAIINNLPELAEGEYNCNVPPAAPLTTPPINVPPEAKTFPVVAVILPEAIVIAPDATVIFPDPVIANVAPDNVKF